MFLLTTVGSPLLLAKLLVNLTRFFLSFSRRDRVSDGLYEILPDGAALAHYLISARAANRPDDLSRVAATWVRPSGNLMTTFNKDPDNGFVHALRDRQEATSDDKGAWSLRISK